MIHLNCKVPNQDCVPEAALMYSVEEQGHHQSSHKPEIH